MQKPSLSLSVCAARSGTLWALRSRKDCREWAARMESSGRSLVPCIKADFQKKLSLGKESLGVIKVLLPAGCQCPTSDKTLSRWRFATWLTLSANQALVCIHGRAPCIMEPGCLPLVQGALHKEVARPLICYDEQLGTATARFTGVDGQNPWLV